VYISYSSSSSGLLITSGLSCLCIEMVFITIFSSMSWMRLNKSTSEALAVIRFFTWLLIDSALEIVWMPALKI